MRNRSIWLIAVLAGLSVLFLATGIYAGKEVKDQFKIDTEGCENTKGLVEFSHKAHSVDYVKEYPELYPNGCGDCHHDDQGKPLTDLKAGMEVQKCKDCHPKCGEPPKGKDAPKLSKAEELEYIAEAYHESCRDCHRDYRKLTNKRNAPTTCTKCHPREKK
jgi:hypothetical protein